MIDRSQGAGAPLAQIGSVTLVGGGNMGGAMLDGWLAAGLPGNCVQVVDPAVTPERRERWEARGVDIVPAPGPDAPAFMMLAVKPNTIEDAIEATRESVEPNTVVVSVVAGVMLERFLPAYGLQARCVRVMPNTPAQIGRGMSVCCPTSFVTDEDRAHVSALLAALGDVEWLSDERLMDAVTAVSGSGPAYLFHMVEALAAAGVEAGLTPSLAARLAKATISGSGELVHRSSETPAQLRKAVTSPNGTTQAGLDVLMPELTDLLTRTVAAAAKRSRELG